MGGHLLLLFGIYIYCTTAGDGDEVEDDGDADGGNNKRPTSEWPVVLQSNEVLGKCQCKGNDKSRQSNELCAYKLCLRGRALPHQCRNRTRTLLVPLPSIVKHETLLCHIF